MKNNSCSNHVPIQVVSMSNDLATAKVKKGAEPKTQELFEVVVGKNGESYSSYTLEIQHGY